MTKQLFAYTSDDGLLRHVAASSIEAATSILPAGTQTTLHLAGMVEVEDDRLDEKATAFLAAHPGMMLLVTELHRGAGKARFGFDTVLEPSDITISPERFCERFMVPGLTVIHNHLVAETPVKQLVAHALEALRGSGQERPDGALGEWLLKHHSPLWEPSTGSSSVVAHRLAAMLATWADEKTIAEQCPICHSKEGAQN